MNIKADNNPRKALLKAAAQLFREKGYERTTVRDLAAAVGMQSGSLFYHFKSKEEILAEVMREGVREVHDAGREALQKPGNAQEKLGAMARAHLNVLLSDANSSLAVLLFDWRSLPQEQQQTIIDMRNEYEQLWVDVLNSAADAGDYQGDVRLTIRLILGALNWVAVWYREDGPLDRDALIEKVIKHISNPPHAGWLGPFD